MSTIFYNHTSSIPFSGGTASAPSITFAGDTDTGIYTGGTANTLRFTVGSSQKARLDVNGLAVYTGNLYIESGQKLNFDLNVSNNYYLQKSSTTLYMHSPVNLSLQTNSSHRLYINQSGNVGIGTTAPAYTLDVNGTAKATTLRVHNNDPAIHFVDSADSTYEGMFRYRNNFLEWLWGGGMKLRVSADGGMAISQDYSTASIPTKGLILPGSVGIGTISPVQKLHVEGNIHNNGSLYIGNSIYHIGDTDTYMKFEENLQRFFAAGEEMLRFNSSLVVINEAGGNNNFRVKGSSDDNLIYTQGSLNRVGIGTVDPRSKLEVKNGTTGQSYTNQSGLLIDVNGTSNSYSSLHVGSNSGANNFVVTNAGNTGLGTASPNNKLQVVGDIDASNYRIGNGIKLEANSSYTMLRDANGVRKIYLGGTADETTYIDGNAHKFRTSGGGTVKMTIASGGNVGIGNTNPTSKLHVAGTSAFEDTMQVYNSSANNDAVSKGQMLNYAILKLKPSNLNSGTLAFAQVDGGNSIGMQFTNGAGTADWDISMQPFGGRVGIGTTSPDHQLQVESAGNAEIQTQRISGAGVLIQSQASVGVVGTNTNHRLDLKTNGGTRMTVTTAGQVGIGTTSPTYELDVAGDIGLDQYIRHNGDTDTFIRFQTNDINLTAGGNNLFRVDGNSSQKTVVVNEYGIDLDFRVESDTVTHALFVEGSTGNVGIGTSTPTAKLEVYSSGSTALDIQGSQGQLFSVTDSLTGSLMSVNDISGLPILEVFDTDKVVMGEFGSNALVVNGDKVGIGTDTPARQFEIHENTTYLTIGEKAGYNPSSYGPILETNSGTMVLPNRTYWSSSNVWIDKNGTSARFHGDGGIQFSYYNGGTLEAMRITNSGNVGIGTTSPQSKLDVAGPITLGGDTEHQLSKRTTSAITSQVTDVTEIKGRQIDLYAYDDVHVRAGTGDNVHIYAQGTERFRIGSDVAVVSSTDLNITGASRRLNFTSGTGTVRTTSNNALYLATNNTNRVTVSGGGNVGIGTTSPAYKLDVSGQIRINHGVSNGSGQALVVGGSGDVTLTSGGSLFFGAYDYGGSTYIRGYDNSAGLYFYADGTLVVNVNGNGNVGIGTTSPQQKLHVEGNIYLGPNNTNNFVHSGANLGLQADGEVKIVSDVNDPSGGGVSDIVFGYGSSTNTDSNQDFTEAELGTYPRVEIMRIDASADRVGIGTSSPSQKLHVNGNTRSTNFYVDNAIYHNGDTDTYIWFTDNRIRIDVGGTTKFDSNNTYAVQDAANNFRALTTDSITPSADRAHNLGLDSARWQIIFCETLDSAGLHEKNLENPEGEKSVGDYATGTVMVWKGGKNVPCTVEADHMRMGIAVEGVKSPLIQGAEPVLVTGIANEGDYLICSEKEGHARAISRQEMLEQNLYDCVLGKALESGEGESYLLKVWITI